MVKKKHDLITKGLSSELFLLAFLEPDNIRKLAQRLQNTSGHPTNYSKASEAIHSLTVSKYLKHKDDGKYHPNISKIVEELEHILIERNESLTDEEKKRLNRILKNRQFLKVISQDIVIKIQNQPKGEHSINALDAISERIGSMSAMCLAMKQEDQKFKSSFDDANKRLYSEIEQELDDFDKMAEELSPLLEVQMKDYAKNIDIPNKEFFIDFFSGFMKYMSSTMPMFMTPDSLLTKLAKLWNQYEGFLLREEISKFNKK